MTVTFGNNSTVDSNVPVSAVASGATAIGGNSSEFCAVVSGALKCWGGPAGDGTTTIRHVPTTATGLTSGVTAVAAGSTNVCAIASGALKCWGDNSYGGLGNGTATATYQTTATTVSGLTSGVTAAASGYTNCAIQSGALKCWGANIFGGVGNGTTSMVLSPVSVIASGVSSVHVGEYDETCAVISGSAKCWGEGSLNGYGVIGNGAIADVHVPAQVTGHTTLVSEVVPNGNVTCDLKDGHFFCWGGNVEGEIGDNTSTASAVPVSVFGL